MKHKDLVSIDNWKKKYSIVPVCYFEQQIESFRFYLCVWSAKRLSSNRMRSLSPTISSYPGRKINTAPWRRMLDIKSCAPRDRHRTNCNYLTCFHTLVNYHKMSVTRVLISMQLYKNLYHQNTNFKWMHSFCSSSLRHLFTSITAMADIVQKMHDQIQVNFLIIKTMMISFQELSVFCTEVISICLNQRTFIQISKFQRSTKKQDQVSFH